MDWIYKKAERKDAGRINELFIEMLKTIYGTDKVEGYLDKFLDGRDEWINIAVHNDVIIAFLSIEVHHEDKEYIYLDDLSVTEQFRNNGIGSKLISNAEEYAKDININTIYFHVDKTNTSAFQLYERLGYKIHEDQGNRYLMIKSI